MARRKGPRRPRPGALYPCVYLTGQFPADVQQTYLRTTVAEAVRCARKAAGASKGGGRLPVLPYQWSYYHNSLDGTLSRG